MKKITSKKTSRLAAPGNKKIKKHSKTSSSSFSNRASSSSARRTKINSNSNSKLNSNSRRTNARDEKETQLVRLNKYIAQSGLISRRKADELISAGAVKVNRQIITELGYKVAIGDFITVNGDPIEISYNFLYVLLNKPKDCITTTDDEKKRKTVMDIVRLHDRIYPVGRLDRNTTGVLLLTNDGELANRLTHPRYQIQRAYNASLDKPLLIADAEKIANGLDIGNGEFSSPCTVNISTENKSKVTIILTEGKNHEVKRLFSAVGYEVKSLDRKFFHNISTKGLERGEYRFLNRKEIAELKRIVKL